MTASSDFVSAIEQLAAAGARVRFTYHGGSGSRDGRDAIIVGVDRAAALIRVRELGQRQSKTMKIERIGWITSLDGDGVIIENPGLIPGARRARATRITDPGAHFHGWAYDIRRHHWEVLGLSMRQFMANRKPYNAWAIDEPPQFAFLEGTIFYRGVQFLQVAFNPGDGFVEVHEGVVGSAALLNIPAERDGWLLREDDLALWLYNGQRPSRAVALTRATSSCDGLMRMLLPPEDVDQQPSGAPGS